MCCRCSCTSGFEWLAPSCKPPRTGSRDISKWAGVCVVALATWSSRIAITSLGPLGLPFAWPAFDVVETAAFVARFCVFGAFFRTIGGFRAVRLTRPTPVFAALLALTLGFLPLASFAVAALALALVVRAFAGFVVRTFLARELPVVALAVAALVRTFAVLALVPLDFLTLAFFVAAFAAPAFFLACMRARACIPHARSRLAARGETSARGDPPLATSPAFTLATLTRPYAQLSRVRDDWPLLCVRDAMKPKATATSCLVRGGAVAVLFAVVLTVSGCFQTAPTDLGALRRRASLDLSCKVVSTYPVVDQRTHLVRGCGKEAVYVRVCQTWSHRYGAEEINCTWLLDRGPTPPAPLLTSANP
jgi:hypothetical protein